MAKGKDSTGKSNTTGLIIPQGRYSHLNGDDPSHEAYKRGWMVGQTSTSNSPKRTAAKPSPKSNVKLPEDEA